MTNDKTSLIDRIKSARRASLVIDGSEIIHKDELLEEITRLTREVEELRGAIRVVLAEDGFSTSDETIDWWVERNQPVEVRTKK